MAELENGQEDDALNDDTVGDFDAEVSLDIKEETDVGASGNETGIEDPVR